MLYNARYNNGMTLLSEKPAGRRNLLPGSKRPNWRRSMPNAASQRQLAAMYITAQRLLGGELGRKHRAFLRACLPCSAWPNRDTGKRLIEAHISYGDQYAKQQD